MKKKLIKIIACTVAIAIAVGGIILFITRDRILSQSKKNAVSIDVTLLSKRYDGIELAHSRNIERNELITGTRLIINRFLSKIMDVPAKTRAIVFQEPNELERLNSTSSLLHDYGFNKECELQNEIDNINLHYYIAYNREI